MEYWVDVEQKYKAMHIYFCSYTKWKKEWESQKSRVESHLTWTPTQTVT